MTRSDDQLSEDKLQAYFDGLLPPHEHSEVKQLLDGHPEILRQVELQAKIDDATRRLFQPGDPEERRIQEAAGPPHTRACGVQVDTVRDKRRRKAVVRVLVASITAVIVWGMAWWFSDDRPEPFFEPRPLVTIYRETVKNGFRPYYYCRDEERFAETFRKRQQIPLVLAKLPEGSRMLGLSYPGGLSRNTTAVLCDVDGKKVLVFVDRLSEDTPIARQGEDATLNVIRAELDGLVVYEVTPLDRAVISKHLVLAGARSEKLAP